MFPQADFAAVKSKARNPKPLKEIAQQGIQPRPRPVVDLQGRIRGKSFKRAHALHGPPSGHFGRGAGARGHSMQALPASTPPSAVRLREAINRIGRDPTIKFI